MISKLNTIVVASVLTAGVAIAGGHGVMVGGFEMTKDKTIVENAAGSEDHTTLVAAVTAAELVETLSGEGPFTVLAPVNDAFAALPEGTVETLLKPENIGTLQTILGCHVIPASAMATDVLGMIESGGGEAMVDTVGGCKLTVKYEDEKVMFMDENGGTATVTIADAASSNGVIHVIDAVLLPKQ
jgi:uncharacterized surface protein with fasciclin (FAS1) repeats